MDGGELRRGPCGPQGGEVDRDRIFEPFFTTKSAEVGTGLGLPMVAAFAERHGGDVRVDSEPGKGAVFTISLPLVRGDEPGPGSPPA